MSPQPPRQGWGRQDRESANEPLLGQPPPPTLAERANPIYVTPTPAPPPKPRPPVRSPHQSPRQAPPRPAHGRPKFNAKRQSRRTGASRRAGSLPPDRSRVGRPVRTLPRRRGGPRLPPLMVVGTPRARPAGDGRCGPPSGPPVRLSGVRWFGSCVGRSPHRSCQSHWPVLPRPLVPGVRPPTPDPPGKSTHLSAPRHPRRRDRPNPTIKRSSAPRPGRRAPRGIQPTPPLCVVAYSL